MKKISFLFVFIIFIRVISIAQAINVPEASKKNFSEKYPSAKVVKWSVDSSGYSASFKEGKNSGMVHYLSDGRWNYTEKFISKSSLPKAVKDAYAKSRKAYPAYTSSAYLESNHGEKAYRIESKKGAERIYIFYTKDGREINSMVAH